MFRYFAENITFALVKNKVLDIKKREIYVYAIEVILLNTILLLLLLGISILEECLSFFVGFLFFFIPLRLFAGGYHAKHSETCFVISISMFWLTIIIFKNYPYLYKDMFAVALYVVANIIFFLYAPLKNPNHPLTEHQYKRNKKIVYIILLLDSIVLWIFAKMNYKFVSSEMLFIMLTSFFLLIGKVENRLLLKI